MLVDVRNSIWRRLWCAIILSLFIFCANAQEISFKDTVRAYDHARITTNAQGMVVLGGWGIANVAAGSIGYFAAQNDGWKHFHEMNLAWGAVNTGLAAVGYWSARRQARQKPDASRAYHLYLRDKRTFLIGVGLDAAYLAAGAILVNQANSDPAHADQYRGYGRSIVVQGLFLLAFDNIMLASHIKYNSRWAVILNEMRFTGNGISFRL